MKKSFGQTVRELKRGVNKKVGKAPGIERKVLDATSNEPWGPDGSLLADIAMATRNHHEYQTIMAVIWKRLNDTGKNWRHVYKALTVLDYLVAHGSEHVIDELREHVYQISTLSDFRYIDSSGRDQGINVRKKSQSLVALVNDRERIIEVRQKAAANRDKFRNTSMGGMYRPGSGGYDGRYDYNRYGNSKSQDGDRYGRDIEDRYSRDGYYRGRNGSIDDYHYGRSRSCNRHHDFDEDDASPRGRGARADYLSPDGRPLERKFSEQLIGAPPSYEEAVSEAQSPVHSEREAETSVAAVPKVSPSTSNNPNQPASDFGNSESSPNQKVEALDAFDPSAPTTAPAATPALPTAVTTASTSVEVDLIGALSDSLAIMPTTPETLAALTDENATPGAIATFAANQPASNDGNQGLDDPFGDGPFKALPSPDDAPAEQQSSASMPSLLPTENQNANIPQPTSVKSETVTGFDFEDLFSAYTCSAPNVSSIQHPPTNSIFLPQEGSTPNRESDILADILPPSGPADVAASHAASFSAPMTQSAPVDATYGQSTQPDIYSQLALSGANVYSQPKQPSANPYGQSAHPSANLYGQPRQPSSNAYGQSTQPGANPYGQPVQPNSNPYGQPAQQHTNPFAQSMQPGSNSMHGNFSSQTVSMAAQIPGSAAQTSNGSLIFQLGPYTPVNTHMTAQPQIPVGPGAQFNAGNFLSPMGSVAPVASLSAHQTTISGGSFSPGTNTSMVPQTTPSSSTGALAIVPQPSKDRFEPKSAVWADTLSRGLINLNISGSEANPLVDIGVDFDAINRKEKRMEKHAPSAVISTVTMGKAMGSGSGIGHAGAGFLRPPTNPMVGSGMGMAGGPVGGMLMGMGGGPIGGIGMGSYGSMNQPPRGMNTSMGMDNGMRQGAPNMPPQTGMPGSYNPVMGSGGYSQQLYGGGYR
ncbi:EPSIN3 [Hibiscus trionum]|uniref:EPSIN3 n=1 Tax=Hibiscus trionum TaxID=183268 RepID=A0A9W7HKT2_HIBTR|nr:EPSIN3 [Hibiscus trionum]